MEREYSVQDFLKQFGFDGGPGSGNWGHAGRIGKKGGSAKIKGGSAGQSGGKQFRAYEASKGYYSVKKSQHFASATKKASKTFSYNRWQRNLSAEQRQAIKTQHQHIKTTAGYKQDLESYQRRIYSMMRGGVEQQRRPQGKPVTVTAEQACGKFQRDASVQPSEITDVLHQQGFDGPAKVVSKKQMDAMLAADPTRPVFYRAYVAPDKQTLDAYDDCAQHGSWYVQCSVGGAQYGKGMYSAGVYEKADGTRYSYRSRQRRQQGAMEQMKHYISQNIAKTKGSCVPPDGIMRIKYSDACAEVEKHTFDELPKQGQVVYISNDSDGYMFARYQRGKFIDCDSKGRSMSWATEYSVDDFKSLSRTHYWHRMSDWQPNPAGTVRKFMIQPDANILTIHSKRGDRKQMNAIIKKANTLLKKQSLKRLDKTQVKDQVSERIDNYTTDPSSFVSSYKKRYEQAQQRVRYYTQRRDQFLAAGYSADHFMVKNQQAYIAAYGRNRDEAKRRHDNLTKILQSYPNPEGFLDKIKEQRKWKALHTYMGKKLCPFKQQTFTPQQQQFLDDKSQTYKTGTWSTYLSYETLDKINRNQVSDCGSAAALLGYDAINAIDHGESGSYTVILNRTKVIYQDQQIDPYKGVS